jgi:hypothetical protein
VGKALEVQLEGESGWGWRWREGLLAAEGYRRGVGSRAQGASGGGHEGTETAGSSSSAFCMVTEGEVPLPGNAPLGIR